MFNVLRRTLGPWLLSNFKNPRLASPRPAVNHVQKWTFKFDRRMRGNHIQLALPWTNNFHKFPLFFPKSRHPPQAVRSRLQGLPLVDSFFFKTHVIDQRMTHKGALFHTTSSFNLQNSNLSGKNTLPSTSSAKITKTKLSLSGSFNSDHFCLPGVPAMSGYRI